MTLGGFVVAAQQCLANVAVRCARERDEALRTALLQPGSGNLGARPMLILQPGAREQLAQAQVACPRLAKEQQPVRLVTVRLVLQPAIGADQRLHAGSTRRAVELHHAKDVGHVGDRERRHAVGRRLLHRFVDPHDAVGDRELGMHAQMDKTRGRHAKNFTPDVLAFRACFLAPLTFGMNPALGALLLGASFIALSPIFVRLSETGPTATAFWRVALAVPFLWFFYLLKVKSDASYSGKWLLLLAAGLTFAGDLAFWHTSIKLTSVANSTLLANLASIFVTLAAWIFLRHKPAGIFLAGLAAALAGVAMLVTTSLEFSATGLIGDALGLVTAMFYAAYILTVKGLRDRGETVLRLMAFTSTLTAAILLPVALVSGESMLPHTAYGWTILLGLALISHAAGQGLIAYALAHLPATFSSVGLLLQPVIAAFFAWVLLAEPLVPLQIAGGLVVLFGIYLARRGSL